MHACSEQVQGQASKPSEGGDLEGEGREGTASEGGEASARGERAAEAGKAGKGGKEAKELDRSKSSKPLLEQARPGRDRPTGQRGTSLRRGSGWRNEQDYSLNGKEEGGDPPSPWLACSTSQNFIKEHFERD